MPADPFDVRPTPTGPAGGMVVAANGSDRVRLYGFGIRAAGGEVDLNIRAGSATGTIIAPVHLQDGETAGDCWSFGVFSPGGVYVEILTGANACEGSIWAETA